MTAYQLPDVAPLPGSLMLGGQQAWGDTMASVSARSGGSAQNLVLRHAPHRSPPVKPDQFGADVQRADRATLTELFALAGAGASSPLIADRLISEVGSLPGVLALGVADFARLGVTQEARRALNALRAGITSVLRRSIEDRPCLCSSAAVIDYLHGEMAHLRVEQFRVLFLNNRNFLIADEVMFEGSVRSAPVFPREIVGRAIELGASAVIMVHNHTSGDPTPSADDIEVTKEIVAAARLFDIMVHDHIVVGRQGHVRIAELGYMD